MIEVRFTEPVSFLDIERLRTHFKNTHPAQEKLQTITFQVPAGEGIQPTTAASSFVAYKLTSKSAEDIVLLGTQSATFSRVAPYPGWSVFKAEARKVWKIHRRVVGNLGIARIGLRYINRIDVPLSADHITRLPDYIKVYVEYPDNEFTTPHSMLCQIIMPASEGDSGGFDAVVSTSSMPSPRPRHFGLLLDIDVARSADLPHGETAFWGMLDAMRDRKNRLFEAAITDKTRALFNV